MRIENRNKIGVVRSWVVWMALVGLVGPVFAQATWDYQDDFSTQKAKKDSYEHSVFWPEGAFPPAEPYLMYTSHHGSPAPGLMLMGFQGRPAHLNYRFPLDSPHGVMDIGGVLSVEVGFPLNTPGLLTYSTSADGRTWTGPAPLGPGSHTLRLYSDQGTCYISFVGTAALIDNLQVRLHSPAAHLVVPLDYRTIQEAIDAAHPGAVIEVLPGIYAGKGNRDIELRGKALTVRSSQGPERTIIDCRAAPEEAANPGHRGFYCHEAETSRTCIQGFTIRGGRIAGSDIPADSVRWNPDRKHPIGAGIYCEFAGPTIRKCIVEDCATELGAGIGCVAGSPSLEACEVRRCQAGGQGNAKSGGMGGGIGLIRECDVSLSDCRIIGNRGYWNSRGGGLYARQCRVRVSACEILSNSGQGVAMGGGVYIGPGSGVDLSHCVILNNQASVGAGVCAESQVQAATLSRVRLTQCTIAFNSLTGPQMPPFPGGGIHSVDSDLTVKNSIVWYNDGTPVLLVRPPSESPVVYCDVERGYSGAGNIEKEPLFASGSGPGVSDVHLQSVTGRYDQSLGRWVRDRHHSPCIDAGDPTDPVGAEPKPNGSRVNMGAYGGTWQASKSKVPTSTTDPAVDTETEADPEAAETL